TVSGSHTYVGDTIGGESEGVASITTVITHEALAAQTGSGDAPVGKPNGIVTGGFTVAASEGRAWGSQVVATVTDPGNRTGTAEDSGDYSATINWGDGSSSAGTITQSGGVFIVTGSHTYVGDTIGGESEGVATITTVITHEALAAQT